MFCHVRSITLSQSKNETCFNPKENSFLWLAQRGLVYSLCLAHLFEEERLYDPIYFAVTKLRSQGLHIYQIV